MENTFGNETSLHLSYLELRKAIGTLGIALPVVLSLGALILFQTGLQGSISGYYYTGMRDVFVGSFGAIGLFLLSYKGYDRHDDIFGNLACMFAIGVALFPTTTADVTASGARIIGYVHLVFATLFFLTLTYFSFFLFTKTGRNKSPTTRKLQRNKVYRACGYVMSFCIILIAIYFFLPSDIGLLFQVYKPVFWLESLADVAFGISWFTKGAGLLADEE